MSCKHIRFVGGGRWATIVLSELAQSFPGLTIDWVCSTDIDKKTELIKGSDIFGNVNLVDSKNTEKLSQSDKVIISTHSSKHCTDLIKHGNGIPDVLIEKPLFSTLSGFSSLSDYQMKNIFLKK